MSSDKTKTAGLYYICWLRVAIFLDPNDLYTFAQCRNHTILEICDTSWLWEELMKPHAERQASYRKQHVAETESNSTRRTPSWSAANHSDKKNKQPAKPLHRATSWSSLAASDKDARDDFLFAEPLRKTNEFQFDTQAGENRVDSFLSSAVLPAAVGLPDSTQNERHEVAVIRRKAFAKVKDTIPASDPSIGKRLRIFLQPLLELNGEDEDDDDIIDPHILFGTSILQSEGYRKFVLRELCGLLPAHVTLAAIAQRRQFVTPGSRTSLKYSLRPIFRYSRAFEHESAILFGQFVGAAKLQQQQGQEQQQQVTLWDRNEKLINEVGRIGFLGDLIQRLKHLEPQEEDVEYQLVGETTTTTATRTGNDDDGGSSVMGVTDLRLLRQTQVWERMERVAAMRKDRAITRTMHLPGIAASRHVRDLALDLIERTYAERSILHGITITHDVFMFFSIQRVLHACMLLVAAVQVSERVTVLSLRGLISLLGNDGGTSPVSSFLSYLLAWLEKVPWRIHPFAMSHELSNNQSMRNRFLVLQIGSLLSLVLLTKSAANHSAQWSVKFIMRSRSSSGNSSKVNKVGTILFYSVWLNGIIRNAVIFGAQLACEMLIFIVVYLGFSFVRSTTRSTALVAILTSLLFIPFDMAERIIGVFTPLISLAIDLIFPEAAGGDLSTYGPRYVSMVLLGVLGVSGLRYVVMALEIVFALVDNFYGSALRNFVVLVSRTAGSMTHEYVPDDAAAVAIFCVMVFELGVCSARFGWSKRTIEFEDRSPARQKSSSGRWLTRIACGLECVSHAAGMYARFNGGIDRFWSGLAIDFSIRFGASVLGDVLRLGSSSSSSGFVTRALRCWPFRAFDIEAEIAHRDVWPEVFES